MKKDNLLFVTCVILMWVVWLLFCAKFLFAQQLQRYRLMPPYLGQMSAYSDWTIPSNAWNELTNCYVDEQGKIVQRPGFYCWLDKHQSTLVKDIQGAYLYQKRIEGGTIDYICFTSDSNFYYTKDTYGSSPTAIEGLLTLSTGGIPNWVTCYNELFMANGENTPIYWNQSFANIFEVGRCYIPTHPVTFQDSNVIEVNLAKDMEGDTWGNYNYHFRVGMDLTISDSNNNGTYEIIAVDSNQITVSSTTGGGIAWTNEETDSSVTLLGESYPDDISSSRTKTITYTTTSDIQFALSGTTYYIRSWDAEWSYLGFIDDMSINISGSASNDGDYTIDEVDYNGSVYSLSITGTFTTGYDTASITFTGTKAITNGDGAFDPDCIAAHKTRLFAGGVSEYPTRLYWTQSKIRDQYYWDLWRNSYGVNEGTGYYNVRDKITALVPEYKDIMVIFCENSTLYLRGDDPGFDILTPSQSLIFQPVPISKDIGCVGPNAWCEVDGDIYFYSKQGLRRLSMIEQGQEAQFTIVTLPVNDLHKSIMEQGRERNIQIKFLKEMNLVFINCAIDHAFNDSLLVYNISNNSFAKWTFDTGNILDPSCIFINRGPQISTLDTELIDIDANPVETLWYASRYGKLFAMCKNIAYDADYEDPNNASISNISATAITAKLNMGNPFVEKTFSRSVFLCSPQINYDPNSQGQLSLYYRADDNSWSSATNKTFTASTEDAGTILDTYEFLDPGVGFRTEGKTLQLKLTTSGTTSRFGFQFVGVLVEFLEQDYRVN